MFTPAADSDSPAGMLVFARERRAAADRAEAQVFQVAAAWAAAHSGDSLQAANWWENGADTGLPIAGPGAPLVSEFAVIEFAAALGMSTDAGRTLIAHAIEVRYRLPKLWRTVTQGTVPVWRARRVATATLGLSQEAAGLVDDHVWIVAHRVGPAQLDRLVGEAKARYQPLETAAERDARADRRHVTVFDDQVSVFGIMHLEADLDLADALAFDKAVAEGAAARAALGSTESLDLRRAAAVGDLARTQLSLDLPTSAARGEADANEVDSVLRRGVRTNADRQVVLYVHLTQDAISGAGALLGRCENTRRPITVEQIRSWCGDRATVSVRPVIDLEDHIGVDNYEASDRLKENLTLRDGACVFPWCTRPARTHCDRDHLQRHAQGGPTCSCNVGPLCRRHHRAKTHGGWTYRMIEPGAYLWRSPHGYQFLRNHLGTLETTPPELRHPRPLCVTKPDPDPDASPDPPEH